MIAGGEGERVRDALRTACSQHLWRPVPPELEDEVVAAAIASLPPEDVDPSPYGPLFDLAVRMSGERLGYGAFATIYDELAVTIPASCPEAFHDGEPGTYRPLRCGTGVW